MREIGQRLTERVPRRRRSGTTHRALTLDDGTLAVTGNYLKVRIPAGHAQRAATTVGDERQAADRHRSTDGELLGG